MVQVHVAHLLGSYYIISGIPGNLPGPNPWMQVQSPENSYSFAFNTSVSNQNNNSKKSILETPRDVTYKAIYFKEFFCWLVMLSNVEMFKTNHLSI